MSNSSISNSGSSCFEFYPIGEKCSRSLPNPFSRVKIYTNDYMNVKKEGLESIQAVSPRLQRTYLIWSGHLRNLHCLLLCFSINFLKSIILIPSAANSHILGSYIVCAKEYSLRPMKSAILVFLEHISGGMKRL